MQFYLIKPILINHQIKTHKATIIFVILVMVILINHVVWVLFNNQKMCSHSLSHVQIQMCHNMSCHVCNLLSFILNTLRIDLVVQQSLIN